MSNPPYDTPDDQGAPWPQYGNNGARVPMQGTPMQGMPMQGGSQNFQGYGSPTPMPIVRGPSKAPGTILIVPGVLASFVTTPILFFVLRFQGVTDTTGALVRGATSSNDSTVGIGGAGSYMLQAPDGEAATRKIIDSGNNAYDVSPFQSDKLLCYTDGLSNGIYTVRYEGVDQKMSMTGMSVNPNDLTDTVDFALLRSIVVGVTGVALLIAGIALAVQADSKTKEPQQQTMVSAMY